VKARCDGRVVSVAVIVAVGVNGDGRREVLGLTVALHNLLYDFPARVWEASEHTQAIRWNGLT
jgi:hypothetical protein